MKKPRIWAEVNLDDLRHNFNVVRSELPAGTRIMAVVKANSYGHGAVPVSIALLEFGVDMFGVGDSSEALELRGVGINVPIVILGGIVEEEIERVVAADITPMLHSKEIGRLMNAEAKRQGKVVNVHLMIDTGMGRLGTSPRRALEVIEAISELKNLRLEGIGSHFSSSSLGDREFTLAQLETFRRVLAEIEAAGHKIPLKHIANSTGSLLYDDTTMDMVRLGGSLLGLDPGLLLGRYELRPILSFNSQVIFRKWLPKGGTVSYGHTFTAERDTHVATLPVGYNDGYSFRLSNRGQVIIRGRRAPVIGRVTMDYTMVDVTDVPEVAVGDDVVLIGSQGGETISALEVAGLIGTTPYEVTCLLGRRVRRVYVRNNVEESVPIPMMGAM